MPSKHHSCTDNDTSLVASVSTIVTCIHNAVQGHQLYVSCTPTRLDDDDSSTDTRRTVLWSQFITGLPVYRADLTGKTVIITGANVGLGLETAKHLATMKPGRLIVTCRDEAKGAETVKTLKAAVSSVNVEAWTLDLADFDSVKAFAKRLETLDRLDIFIENAGVAFTTFQKTKDGHEANVQVNVISTVMLALLSLPKLRETVRKHKTEPRIVLVASEVHHWAKFPEQKADKPLAALNVEADFSDERYMVTKLLDVLATRRIAELLQKSKHPEDASIRINAPNPGWCHSALLRHRESWGLSVLKQIMCRSTELGSRNFVWAALAPQPAAEQGAYVSDCAFEEPSDLVISAEGDAIGRRVWKELEDIYKKECPAALEVF